MYSVLAGDNEILHRTELSPSTLANGATNLVGRFVVESSAFEGELKTFRHARKDVERSADVMLGSGMETKNQNQMGVALQVR